ncbi:hypothetical protein [Prosthecobacter fusiformis]|nr:hypothetical protein [Prosthecobacter fusiformis]
MTVHHFILLQGRFIATILITAFLTASSGMAEELFDETQVTTLFAFDNVSIPHVQNLRMEMRSPKKHPSNPVLTRGAAGTPDAKGVQFYGSIIRENNKYRLWYVAFDDDKTNKVASSRWRAAYAESDDGLNWVKPNLGLVEFAGNKNNNLILTQPAPFGFVNVKVLLDPEDPDPARRYKISSHVYFRHNTRLGTLMPFVSADGLTWRSEREIITKKAELQKKDVLLPGIHFEPSGGLYKWDGMFYASGQNSMDAPRPYHGRVARVYRSPDFYHWSQTSSLAFTRTAQNTLLGPGRSREGEQTHEGISVWNRGNILLGISGVWHGAKEWKDVSIDLGFVVSNNGVHFREPAYERLFLERGKDGEWDQGGLIQGQGFENIGDETFVYYGAWDPRHWEEEPLRGGVGIAVLPRDRFGDLVVEKSGEGPGDYQLPEVTSEFITKAIDVRTGSSPRFYVNAEGLGNEASLKIELLDAQERPVPGYSGKNAAIVTKSGFQTPVEWKGKTGASGLPKRICVHVSFEGKRNTDIRFSALYISPDL